jgi:hypothetical protein
LFADEARVFIAADHVLLPNPLPVTRSAIVRVNDALDSERRLKSFADFILAFRLLYVALNTEKLVYSPAAAPANRFT